MSLSDTPDLADELEDPFIEKVNNTYYLTLATLIILVTFMLGQWIWQAVMWTRLGAIATRPNLPTQTRQRESSLPLRRAGMNLSSELSPY
jgi:hypothetical protein